MGGFQVFKLQGHFLAEHVAERVGGNNDGLPGQGAFGIDVGFAELLFRHTGAGVEVAVPEDVGPVGAASVKRAAVIEDVCAYIRLRLA